MPTRVLHPSQTLEIVTCGRVVRKNCVIRQHMHKINYFHVANVGQSNERRSDSYHTESDRTGKLKEHLKTEGPLSAWLVAG